MSALILLLVFMTSVNPNSAPVAFILVPIILSWVFIYSVTRVVVEYVLKRGSGKVFSILVATGCVVALLLSGLGQLAVRDILLMAILGIVGVFYYERSRGA